MKIYLSDIFISIYSILFKLEVYFRLRRINLNYEMQDSFIKVRHKKL